MKISTVYTVPTRSGKFRGDISKIQATEPANGTAESMRDIHTQVTSAFGSVKVSKHQR